MILLTAMADETERVVGLEIGADDCVGKPLNPRELLARIRAVLRRVPPPVPRVPTGRRNFSVWRHDPAVLHIRHNDGRTVHLDIGQKPPASNF